jgi:N-hydroxyarylamine O-acetyltransferase
MLGEKLLERILERLGLTTLPRPDHDGLSSIYAAWCTSVPFDNIAKLIALRSGSASALPGLDATEFFERWLEHGIGGTCWPSSNALFELLVSSGFNARAIAGSMRDTGIVSHASIKVSSGGIDWLVDSSMLTAAPIPLTDEIHIPDDKLFGAEVEFVGGTHVVWANLPPNPNLIPCRMLVDPATPEYCAERYEASRLRSPFNERLYAKRNTADGQLVLMANLRISRTATGPETRELTASKLCESLRDEIGVSGVMVEEWRRSGALEASFRPPSGPPPVAITTLAPSLRFIRPR